MSSLRGQGDVEKSARDWEKAILEEVQERVKSEAKSKWNKEGVAGCVKRCQKFQLD